MKKILERIIVFSLVVLLFAAVCPQNTFAANDLLPTVPMYTGAIQVSANVIISSSGYATAIGKVKLLPGYTADVTLQLKYDSGSVSGTWIDSGSGTIPMEKGKYIMSGHDYYTVVHVVVYDSTGKTVDDITLESNRVSY